MVLEPIINIVINHNQVASASVVHNQVASASVVHNLVASVVAHNLAASADHILVAFTSHILATLVVHHIALVIEFPFGSIDLVQGFVGKSPQQLSPLLPPQLLPLNNALRRVPLIHYNNNTGSCIFRYTRNKSLLQLYRV